MAEQTHTNLSREELAKIEIGQTTVSPRLARLMMVFLVGFVFCMPFLQWLVDRSDPNATGSRAVGFFRELPALARETDSKNENGFQSALAFNARLLSHINTFDRDLDNESILSRSLLAPTQTLLLRWGGVGNEKVYPGRKGWFFYRPALDSLTGPGFLTPWRLAVRSRAGNEYTDAPQPDPRPAILDFHTQLAERGIELILLPAPAKGTLHPEKFSHRYEATEEAVHNPSYRQLIDELTRAGVRVFDPAPILWPLRGTGAFLKTDTHWSPNGMERVAEALSKIVRTNYDISTDTMLCSRETSAVVNQGDIADMLRLPPSTCIPLTESTTISVVSQGQMLWRPSKEAEVLLLGDSYTNQYSQAALGWGESAGFAEQLSFYLQAPIDCISQNGSGAWATRQTLSRELARGRDRLAGKKMVIWEFAARELALGDWKVLDMTLGAPRSSQFYVPPAGQSPEVTGVIEAISSAPRPGSVPYKDHILTIHLRDITLDSEESENSDSKERQAVVYAWSMRDNVWTPAARYRIDETIRLRLKNWQDMVDQYGAINRSELDDMDLLLEEPCWGEIP